MPVSKTARPVGAPSNKGYGALSRALDAMEVNVDSDGYWVEIMEHTNHVPAQLKWAQKRHPGREYVWDYDDVGVRVWRTK